MDKIYTRHRIRIPKIKVKRWRNKSRKTKKLFNLIFVLIIAFTTAIIIIRAITPVFNNLCEERAKSMVTIVSNEQATAVMKEYSYNNLFEIEKDNEGNVNMIKSNIFTINEITSEVAVKIQKEINENNNDNIEIPLGTFTGSKILSGRGPDINIKISIVGNVETDLKSEFIAKGVNQTLHRVYLQVNCNAVVLTPFQNIETKRENQVLLVENVIVGNIPESYYNFEGTDRQDTALETVN